MHLLRWIICAAVILAAGSSLRAQEPVRNLQDLVGARGGDGEHQMKQRGYRFQRTQKSGHAAYNYFTESRSNRCVTVHVADGRYQSIVYAPDLDCKDAPKNASAAATAGNLQDLVGARASSGESQLHQRGYRLVRNEVQGQGRMNYWQRGRECVAVEVFDGKYSYLNSVPNDRCAEGGGHQPAGEYRGGEDFRIRSAKYGTGGNYRNVESALGRMSSNDGVNTQVNNQTMGGDPAPGREKELIVDYEYRGRRQTARVREGETLNIGRSGGGSGNDYQGGGNNWGHHGSGNLQILSATYGARGQNRNVEYILRKAASSDGLSMPVNNQTMEGDPVPGTEKELVVRYRLNGRNNETRVREGDTLKLGRSY